MNIRKCLPVALLAVLMGAIAAHAFRGFVSTDGDAAIHWGNGDVVATVPVQPVGDVLDPVQARSLAVRSAVVSARRQLLEAVEDIRIDSGQTVGYYMAEDFDVAENVRMLLQNSKLTLPLANSEDAPNELGSVTAAISLRGKLAEEVLPTTTQFLSGIPPKLNPTAQGGEDEQQSLMGLGVTPSSGYTGVVVDARGLDIAPALCPVVFDAQGVGVYGAFMVSRTQAVSDGVAAYSTTDEWVVVRSRVGESPLVVKAISKARSTDPVISMQDATLARAVLSKPGIGEEGRVVIVLDEASRIEPSSDMEVGSGDVEPIESADLEE